MSERKPRLPRAPRTRRPTPPGPPFLKGRGQSAPSESERVSDVLEATESISPLPFREGGPGGVGSSHRPPVPHLVTGQTVDPIKRELAYRLRREMTPAEHLLWEQLRASRLRGIHFRRQQIVHGFIADFYCRAAGVVVEVDGAVHATQAEYDAARDLAFAGLGLLVMRFRNEDVTEHITRALERIANVCVDRLTEQRKNSPTDKG
ncbi:MAG TPA: DUF559 domain-containing protein [Gemmata sp.]